MTLRRPPHRRRSLARSRLARCSLTLFWRAAAGMLLLAVVLLSVGPPPTAAAHEQLLRADPAAGATVTGPVAVIRLTFSDAISPGFAAATFAVDDQPARSVNVTVDGATLTVVPPDPAPTTRQRWTLAYRVVSGDGHPIVDQLSFTVTPSGRPTDASAASTQSSPPAPAPATQPSAGPGRRWLAAVGGVLLVGVVAVAARVRRRTPAPTGARRGEPR